MKLKNSTLSVILCMLLLLLSSISGCGNMFNIEELYSSETESSEDDSDLEFDSYEYNIPDRYYSDGIKNIVKRSRQIYEMTWLPVQNLTGFNGDYVFQQGVEVRGIPYSQPVTNGKFLIYQATLDEFLSKSKEKDGPFYTERGTYEEPSTYYGMDCSSFVSYSWSCRNRLTAKNLSEFGDSLGNKLNSIQVGDALIRTEYSAHAVLVTGVKEDSNKNIIWIEITEQTVPITKRTVYGDGELYSIDEFMMFYLEDGYKIYRDTKHRDNITYTHSCASPLNDLCDKCYELNEHKKVSLREVLDDNIILEVEFAPIDSDSKISFSYNVSHIHLGTEKYITDINHYIKLRNEPNGDKTILIIPPNSFISVFDLYTDEKGELWGKTKYNSKTGWVYLQLSAYLGGKVFPYEEINVPEESCSEIDVENYSSAYRCIISIPKEKLDDGKKIQIFAHDSNGNKYLVGEYTNSFL